MRPPASLVASLTDDRTALELLADRNPEPARQLLDLGLERMMEAVHRYEDTVD